MKKIFIEELLAATKSNKNILLVVNDLGYGMIEPYVKKFPQKPNSVKLKKNSKFSGKLMGVKGQYLIFEDDKVVNYRAHEGHIFSITINS